MAQNKEMLKKLYPNFEDLPKSERKKKKKIPKETEIGKSIYRRGYTKSNSTKKDENVRNRFIEETFNRVKKKQVSLEERKKEEYYEPKIVQEKREKKSGSYKFLTFSIILIFLLIVTILVNQSKLDEKVKKINHLKENLEKLNKENAQEELLLQNKMSLTVIEQKAAAKLGMQKLSNNNTVYVKIKTEDFVEPIVVNRVEKEVIPVHIKIYMYMEDLYNKVKNFTFKK